MNQTSYVAGDGLASPLFKWLSGAMPYWSPTCLTGHIPEIVGDKYAQLQGLVGWLQHLFCWVSISYVYEQFSSCKLT
jgi:hypothetical protein